MVFSLTVLFIVKILCRYQADDIPLYSFEWSYMAEIQSKGSYRLELYDLLKPSSDVKLK